MSHWRRLPWCQGVRYTWQSIQAWCNFIYASYYCSLFSPVIVLKIKNNIVTCVRVLCVCASTHMISHACRSQKIISESPFFPSTVNQNPGSQATVASIHSATSPTCLSYSYITHTHQLAYSRKTKQIFFLFLCNIELDITCGCVVVFYSSKGNYSKCILTISSCGTCLQS